MPEPRDPAKEMQQRYKNVFGTVEGRIVLGDILTLGHFGDTIDPTASVQAAEHNFAVTIARMAGAFDSVFKQYGMTKET